MLFDATLLTLFFVSVFCKNNLRDFHQRQKTEHCLNKPARRAGRDSLPLPLRLSDSLQPERLSAQASCTVGLPSFLRWSLRLLPVGHCRALSLALGQGEAVLPQVELQTPSLHQPVRRLQDLRGQGLGLAPLLQALAAPGSSFGHNAPRGGGGFGLLTDAIQVFHRVFASFSSSGSATAGKHDYLQSEAAD